MQPLEDPATQQPGGAPQLNPVADPAAVESAVRPTETGGPEGPEPTRYGDWERKGRCIDF